jgi:predicted nucleic acid-binding protein
MCPPSTVAISELRRKPCVPREGGRIAQQRAQNPPFADTLSAWLASVLALYSDRVLAIDTATARRWGGLSASIGHSGADLMIAATALEHGLTVVTRNTRHFAPAGVPVFDPFAPVR